MRDVDGNSPTFGSTLLADVTTGDDAITIAYKATDPEKPLDNKTSVKVDLSLDNSKNKDANDKLMAFGREVRSSYSAFAEMCEPSEFVPLRNYHVGLVMAGKVMDAAMSAGACNTNTNAPLKHDTKPECYTPFLVVYGANIAIQQLGINKVHSDYGGIPMQLRPGSCLETSATPVFDSTNFNRVLSLVSAVLYAPDTLPNLKAFKPKILDFSRLILVPKRDNSGQNHSYYLRAILYSSAFSFSEIYLGGSPTSEIVADLREVAIFEPHRTRLYFCHLFDWLAFYEIRHSIVESIFFTLLLCPFLLG
ncbi:hypothetical protein G7Y89_g14684 [Cudoniella acicularis]|uniref:Uncharacterized protein n=1 Tax=Cudoniella acicularis TaxID=354080 RepID=A0A8H4R1J4_9HELO|nr:hypothetical protein G7Y89_g14684 [Cudoniella acicularis]